MLSGAARWVMAKRQHALAAAFIMTLLPWLFWIGAAICALVIMRKGPARAVPVVIAGLLPSLFWAFSGNHLPLCGMLVTLVMAILLRVRVRWGETVLGGALTAAVLVQSGLLMPPHASELLDRLKDQSGEIREMFAAYQAQGLDPHQLGTLVIGMMAGAVLSLVAVAVLALARYLQAVLYNPGGFKSEFHRFRLAPRELAICIAIGLAGILLGAPAAILAFWLPLLIAGIALMHGVAGLKRMNGLWLAVFYILLLTAWPVIVIVLVLAFADCFADFRTRLASRQH